MRVQSWVTKANVLVLVLDGFVYTVAPQGGDRTQADVDRLKDVARLADSESQRLRQAAEASAVKP